MTLSERILADLTAAMKAKDTDKTRTLRMVKAALTNRKIEKGSELTDSEITNALQSLIKQRRDSIESYEKAGRPELVAKEAAEIAIIETYLPKAATAEEMDAAIEAAIAETGASSLKDMGNVMKSATAKLSGRTVDRRALSEKLKAKLR